MEDPKRLSRTSCTAGMMAKSGYVAELRIRGSMQTREDPSGLGTVSKELM